MRTKAIPIHNEATVVVPSSPVVLSKPARAIRFRIGKMRKAKGHTPMQKLYIFA
jgi:hypothetical protein